MKHFESGTFYAGCNYWASHAGMYMWRNWDAATVENDFKLLSELGITLVRVYPLWSDFQPVRCVFGYRQNMSGFSRDGDMLLDTTDPCIDEVMMERFGVMLDLATKYNLKVMPALLTGWMSGRVFVPPALEGKNLICDPMAIRWEVRFIRAFVKRFKHHDAVYAWGLGNECNCLSAVENSDQAYHWLQTVSDAIRGCDPTRPVICGMHGQTCPGEGNWVMQDAGENCDFLTTHPYASPSYTTDREHTNTIKPMMHPSSQTLYVKGVGLKPCIIEETGTFGQLYSDDEVIAKYAEGCLYSAWAHNCLAWLWWIGFDQGSLRYHPFGYNNRASNYGLYREDGSIKPVGEVVRKFNAFLKSFPYEKLPERMVDGLCVLTGGQKAWPAAGASFILAKQVGLDLDYCFAGDAIPEAQAYFLPSVETNDLGVDKLELLMERVANGALVYVSVGSGNLRNLNTDFGFRLKHREFVGGDRTVCIDGENLPVFFKVQYDIDVQDAEVLATDASGAPVYLRVPYGKGQLFFLMAPLETAIYPQINVFEKPYYKFYAPIATYLRKDKILTSLNPMVSATEHPINDGERIVILTAYTEADTKATFEVQGGWTCPEFEKNQNFKGSETKVFVFKKV